MTWTGHTLTGWSDGAHTYQPGDSVTVTGAETLTAQWATTTYPIVYLANGSSDAVPTSSNISYNGILTIGSAITNYGYTFAGWGDSISSGAVSTYAPGQYYGSASNLILYAQWTIQSYTLTYDKNSGTGTPPNQVTQNYNTTVKIGRAHV